MEPFQLTNEPPKRKRPDVPPEKQKVLFSGLDCLPGQLDLFKTDGYDAETASQGDSHDTPRA
jgi:hypothetical protein